MATPVNVIGVALMPRLMYYVFQITVSNIEAGSRPGLCIHATLFAPLTTEIALRQARNWFWRGCASLRDLQTRVPLNFYWRCLEGTRREVNCIFSQEVCIFLHVGVSSTARHEFYWFFSLEDSDTARFGSYWIFFIKSGVDNFDHIYSGL